MRSALAFIAAALIPPSPVILTDAPVISPKAIVQVICIAPDKNPAMIDISSGTAFRIGAGIALSVRHVTSARGHCSVEGKPMSVLYTSNTADFSMIRSGDGPFLKVDCGGFVRGRKYLALGFARGLPEITSVELTATGETDGGMAILSGIFSVVPGMSGGAVISEDTGAVVGTVNVENFEAGLSGSVPLSATHICAGRVA